MFSKTYFAIRSFDSRSSLLTWIYRITVNECYDYLRKRRARRLVYESDFSAEEAQCLETAEHVVDPAARVDRQLLERDLVVTLLSKVPEQARMMGSMAVTMPLAGTCMIADPSLRRLWM